MQKILYSNVNFFETLVQFSVEGKDVDLHNNYDCSHITFSIRQKQLILIFLRVVHEALLPKKIVFNFNDVVLAELELTYEDYDDMRAIENIYRGRAEINGGLIEEDKEGRSYFYISFMSGVNIELFAKHAEVTMH